LPSQAAGKIDGGGGFGHSSFLIDDGDDFTHRIRNLKAYFLRPNAKRVSLGSGGLASLILQPAFVFGTFFPRGRSVAPPGKFRFGCGLLL
jgi:hypothetical protein